MNATELETLIQTNTKQVVFFKTKGCGVCTAQLPGVTSLCDQYGYPIEVIDLSENLALAASQMVLNVPVTKVFINGKEVFKEGAYLRFEKLEQLLAGYNA
jgi:hypothetical protein